MTVGESPGHFGLRLLVQGHHVTPEQSTPASGGSGGLSRLFYFTCCLEFPQFGGALGKLILIPFPWLASLPDLNLQDLSAYDLSGAWWLISGLVQTHLV